PIELEEIVVTASRTPEPAARVPSPTTVLDGEELRRRGVRLVGDALREVPSALVVPTGSWGGVTSLFLRGGESDYVKVLVDGVPLNAPGGYVDLAALTLDNVERIEVVRGPASVLYGSDAVAGVVQLFTRQGGGPARAGAALTGGSFGSWAGELWGAAGDERLGASLGAARSVTDGTYDFNSDFENTVLSARAHAAPGSASTVAVTARWGDHTSHFPTDFSGAPVDRNQRTFEQALTLGADASHRFSSTVEARLGLALHDADGGSTDDPDDAADTTGFAYAAHRTRDASRRGADLRVLLRPHAGLTLATGVAYEREAEAQSGWSTSNFGTGPFTDPDTPFDQSRATRGWYAQASARPLEPVSLTAGARVDDSDGFGSFTTWRAGAVVQAARATRLRAVAGTAFKAPSLAETWADSPFEVGNPDLDPERTRSWELGIAQELLEGDLVLEAGWFDQQFEDLIQYQSADPGEATYFNLGAAVARGLELGAHARLGSRVRVGATWTRLHTEVTESGTGATSAFAPGEELLRRPSSSGTVSVDVLAPRGVRLGARVSLVGTREDLDFASFPATRVSLDGYALTDFSVEVPLPVSTPLLATFRVENAFDAGYETIVGYPGRGRALFAGLRTRR
ncbi:MAG TPA: TonB-dependent receptor, partial [Gemmatimonadales bacterium]|nr:TonB-dependent receptor [Gemmatimonadales bacterium]